MASELGACQIAPGLLRLERCFDLDAPQGRFAPSACVPALPGLLDKPIGRPEAWTFLDTETSGLAGGTGTWAFLTGIARIEGRQLHLRQYLLTRLDAEPPYLEAIQAELASTSLLVTYNGKSFDAPLLTTRLRLAGAGEGLGEMPHLDLLHPVRRAFAGSWPDCRLATAECRLLGLRRTGDLPGCEAPRSWLAWLRHGEVAPLARVLEHNRQDIRTLPALVPALVKSLHDPAGAGADVGAVARYWLARGAEAPAFQALLRGRSGLGESGLMDLARLHRRRGEWTQACRIWRTLARSGHSGATEAMAKYLEHQERDYARALALTASRPAGAPRERRRLRLESKLGNLEPGPQAAGS